MPFGARKPVAKTSSFEPSLVTLRMQPLCSRERAPPAAARIHRAALGEVEVAGRVGLQVEGELVEARRDLHVVVEVLVEVGLAVAVQVVQPGDLVAAEDVDLVVDDLQAQRLEQARGEAPPRELLELVVDAGDDPDVAAPGADRRIGRP